MARSLGEPYPYDRATPVTTVTFVIFAGQRLVGIHYFGV